MRALTATPGGRVRPPGSSWGGATCGGDGPSSSSSSSSSAGGGPLPPPPPPPPPRRGPPPPPLPPPANDGGLGGANSCPEDRTASTSTSNASTRPIGRCGAGPSRHRRLRRRHAAPHVPEAGPPEAYAANTRAPEGSNSTPVTTCSKPPGGGRPRASADWNARRERPRSAAGQKADTHCWPRAAAAPAPAAPLTIRRSYSRTTGSPPPVQNSQGRDGSTASAVMLTAPSRCCCRCCSASAGAGALPPAPPASPACSSTSDRAARCASARVALPRLTASAAALPAAPAAL